MLIIEGTDKSPYIKFDNNGEMAITGRSIPENSIKFYEPLIEWLKEYSKRPAPTTILNVKLEYFNTSSSKCLLEVFKYLENIKKNENDVSIFWYYDDDDDNMKEAGEDYESLIHVKFVLVEGN